MKSKLEQIDRPRAQAQSPLKFYEFFAGGGMARAGLGHGWDCAFANDFDKKKIVTYAQNWGGEKLVFDNIWDVKPGQLEGEADLAWASFPCQDLSLAGNQAGLEGSRSGAFWGFWNLMLALRDEGRNPRMIVLENVYGTVTSNGGEDFKSLLDALSGGGYRAGALVVDAVHFVPQSRPRLFIIAVRKDIDIPAKFLMDGSYPMWTPPSLGAVLKTPAFVKRRDWISWRLSNPPARRMAFSDLIDDEPEGVGWHSSQETTKLLDMMSDHNKEKVRKAQISGRKMVGTIYKRTRPNEEGTRSQRAEVRFDEVAGCLRTPGGGSSRQTILVVEGRRISSRLLAPREAARLMGLPESYVLPTNYNDAYHLAGDGVVVPVVRHLASYIIEPLLTFHAKRAFGAA
jgi:DNA (cytosine-5)-methyltransferase 1